VSSDPIWRIDAQGQVTVEGSPKRPPARAGVWHLITSTPSLLMLARDSDSGRAPERVALAGDIDAAGGLFDVIAFVHQSGWSGALHALEGSTHRTVWFKRGEIQTCGSNIDSDRLGELLYRYGRISREVLDRAIAQVGPHRRLGQALVEMGAVSSHDVFTFIRKQVEEVFFALLRVRQGCFFFERSKGDEKLPDLALSTQNLLLEGARRMDEMHYFREKIPSSDCLPVRRHGTVRPPPAEEQARSVLELCDGTRTVDDVARESQLGEFEATRALYQLVQSGHIEVHEEYRISRSGITAPKPDRGRSGLEQLIDVANELLARIHATLAESGKLERFRADLGAFFRGATGFAQLFEGIEPGDDGKLPPDKLMTNLDRLGPTDKAQYLHQGLSELVFFLVFTVGEHVGYQEEQELSHRLSEITKQLQAKS
jgi:hypothetical protein